MAQCRPCACGFIKTLVWPSGAISRYCLVAFLMVSSRQSLGLQDQQAAARMDDDEVRMRALRPDRHVAPEQLVVVEFLLQALSKPLFARRHARDASAQRRNEYSQFTAPVCIALHHSRVCTHLQAC